MLNQTKQLINSQKREIFSLAFNQFKANFVSVMNGKNKYLTRSNYNFAHLRFTQTIQVSGNIYKKLDPRDYKDTYVYFTKSTTTDKRTKLEQKIKENLSDRCFNVRSELLAKNPSMKCDYYFVVDLGGYWAYVSLEYARNHIIKYNNFQGREIATVRLPNRFYKKTRYCKLLEQEDSEKVLKFDARYIQNCTYSKYRKRNGFIKVEAFKNGQLATIKYYTSTGEAQEDFKAHGLEFTTEYFRSLASQNKSIKRENVEYKFSRVDQILDSNNLSFTLKSDSIIQTPKELGLPLQSYIDRSIDQKIVMVNPTNLNENLNEEEEIYDIYKEPQQIPEVSHETIDWRIIYDSLD